LLQIVLGSVIFVLTVLAVTGLNLSPFISGGALGVIGALASTGLHRPFEKQSEYMGIATFLVTLLAIHLFFSLC
jgi:hypothetical protein